MDVHHRMLSEILARTEHRDGPQGTVSRINASRRWTHSGSEMDFIKSLIQLEYYSLTSMLLCTLQRLQNLI